MKLKYLCAALVLVSLVIFSGCQPASTSTSGTTAATASATAAAASTNTAAAVPTGTISQNTTAALTTTPTAVAAATAPPVNAASEIQFPYTFSDDSGRTVTLTALPRRLVSLSPSNTEMVFALGLGDNLVGDTKYCNYPEAAKTITRVGGFSDVDIEKVVSVQPDLILAASIHEEKVLPALEKLGIPIMLIHPITLEGINQDITLLGRVTGKTQAAADLTAQLKARVEAIRARSAQTGGAKARVMYVTWHDPIYTAGDNTITGELIKIAGGENIAGDVNDYDTITLEKVVERNPQIIVVMSSMGSNKSIDYINTESRLQATEALKNQRVFQVDSDLFGRTTPRIVDALEQLAQIIQP